MNRDLVLRLIALVQKNGDRVVLADPNSGEGVVVMDLSSYEELNAALDSRSGSVPPSKIAAPSQRRHGRDASPADDGLFESVSEKGSESHGGSEENRSAAYADAPAATPKSVAAEQKQAPPTGGRGPDSPDSAPVLDQNETRGRRQTSSFDSGPATAELADLTQDQLMAKINRDINEWKTAKEKKQIQDNRSAEPESPATPPNDNLEEEERFYLEPIE